MGSVFNIGIDAGFNRSRPVAPTMKNSMECARLAAERVPLRFVMSYRVLDGVPQQQMPIKNALAQGVSAWDRASNSGDGDLHGGPGAVAIQESSLLASGEPGIPDVHHLRDMTDPVPIQADRRGLS